MERWGKQYHLTFRKLKFTKNLTILSITWPIFTTRVCGKVMFSAKTNKWILCFQSCLSVCLCVCVSICSEYNFWTTSHRDFIFGMQVKLEYQSHWVKVKVMWENDNFTYFNMLILCIWLQVINEVKVINQGERDIKVKVKISTSFPILCQILLIWTHYSSVCGYKSWKVKFIHQGEGHIRVKVTYLHPFKFYVAHTFCRRVVCIQLNAFLFISIVCLKQFIPRYVALIVSMIKSLS